MDVKMVYQIHPTPLCKKDFLAQGDSQPTKSYSQNCLIYQIQQWWKEIVKNTIMTPTSQKM
jgi:hypothetical protein